jgi:hypothetical protein
MSDPFHGLDPAGLMAAAAMPTDGDADTLPLSGRICLRWKKSPPRFPIWRSSPSSATAA